MTMSDPIADMLTRIRNALMARHKQVEVPSSKLKEAIARVLKEEGYIEDYEVIPDNKQGILRITLKYYYPKGSRIGEPVIERLARISKPSRRVYVGWEEIPYVRSGLGIAILSTNKGVMSDRKARAQKVGGELICEVW